MTISQSALIERFSNGATHGEASHMFIEGDTLYSYGHHFPLLIRTDFGYVQNGDKYSITTSCHQSQCSHLATVIIPFSALESARIPPCCFTLVDKTAERYDTRTYKDSEGNMHEVEERRPESCLLENEGHYYLSSMDMWQYFLVELPEACQTTDDAFEMLIPAEAKGRNYQRQGEWFVFEADALPIQLTVKGMPLDKARISKMIYKTMQRNYTLPHRDNGNPHTATRGDFINGVHYISGQLHHSEHRMLRLSKSDNPVIFEAWENTALNSWAAQGNVD